RRLSVSGHFFCVQSRTARSQRAAAHKLFLSLRIEMRAPLSLRERSGEGAPLKDEILVNHQDHQEHQGKKRNEKTEGRNRRDRREGVNEDEKREGIYAT